MPKRSISNSDFCHIHNHTEYSTFDGVNKVIAPNKDTDEDKLVSFPARARHMGFKALGITDHGAVGGLIKFMQECKAPLEIGGKELPPIKPLLGCEFYLARNRHVRADSDEKMKKEFQPEGRKGNRHILIIAKDWKGYQNLCRLAQASWTEGYYSDPRIDFELLQNHHEGLICSSACLSSVVNNNLLRDRYDQAKKSVALFKDIFGRDFFLEAMYHGLPEEGAIIPDILRLGKEMDVNVVCTNDCHYSTPDQGDSHQMAMAMATSRCIHDPKCPSFPFNEFYLKSATEMGKIFGTHPELLLNTMKVAERVDNDDIEKHMGDMRLPKYDLPEGFNDSYEYMVHLAKEGMKRLGWANSKPHIDQIKIELADVRVALERNGYDFATYFLIVRDYIKFANDNGILTGPGRGSGYASVLLMALDITYGVDPLEYGLIWERFLGFDTKRFIQASDFGLEDLEDEIEEEEPNLMEATNDEAGIGRIR